MKAEDDLRSGSMPDLTCDAGDLRYVTEMYDTECPVILLARVYGELWDNEWRCLVSLPGEMRIMSLRTNRR